MQETKPGVAVVTVSGVCRTRVRHAAERVIRTSKCGEPVGCIQRQTLPTEYQVRFTAQVRGSDANVDFEGTRRFHGLAIANEAVDRTATRSRKGDLASFGASAPYELRSRQLFLRPTIAVDYYRLEENTHAEKTAGEIGLALSVADRTSNELIVTGSVGGGVDVFNVFRDLLWRRL